MSTDTLVRNNVTVRGDAGRQPMVFAHGFGCDQNMWRFVAPAFEDRYRVVLLDYVGTGRSDTSAYSAERYGSLDGYAEDVLDVCRALDLTDVILVGHSVSSSIGLLAALKEPERFSRLIFVSPSPRFVNDSDGYVGGFERSDIDDLLVALERDPVSWSNALAPVVMRNPEQPELTEELAASFCAADPAIARRFAEVTFLSDNRADFRRLTVPSLILQCADDLLAPQEVGAYLHRETPGSRLTVLDVSGHCPHMSAPEETIAAIEAYLDAAP